MLHEGKQKLHLEHCCFTAGMFCKISVQDFKMVDLTRVITDYIKLLNYFPMNRTLGK